MSLDYRHSRIRNLALVCILVPLLAVPLSGCAEPTPTPEPVTLILAHQDARAESYKALVQGFMASHPYITIKLVRPGAPGADVFEGAPNEGKMKFNGSENDFIRAAGFRSRSRPAPVPGRWQTIPRACCGARAWSPDAVDEHRSR